MSLLANVALPAFFPHSIATLLGVFVIAAIEGWFLKRSLGLGFKSCYGHSLYANWRSTIVGIPFAWLLWMVGLIPISLGFSAGGFDVHPAIKTTFMKLAFSGGMFPSLWSEIASASAWIILLIPFWYGSVWIERWTIEKRLPNDDPVLIKKAVVRGNLASYAVFLLLGVWALASAISDFPERKERFEEQRK